MAGLHGKMSEIEIQEFLAGNAAGVLALAARDQPYAVPIFFRFDPDSDCCYIRLATDSSGEKRQFLVNSSRARLVVFDRDDNEYTSVIVKGTLRGLPTDAITTDDIGEFGRTPRPLFELWQDPPSDLDI